MPTFSGNYVREPSDFMTVATEAALIQVADDPDTPAVPVGTTKWADLQVDEAAALVSILDPIIISKEGVINGYLRAGGYTIPADVASNPVLREYTAKLVWNALRYRKEQISDDALETQDGMVMRELRDIANGVSVIVVGEDTATEPPSATVYAIGTAQRIFSRDTLEDM